MENEKLQVDWMGIFIVWMAFFVLLAIILFPAFRYRSLAKKYNKKGWPYFLVGIVMGFVVYNLMGLIKFFIGHDTMKYSFLFSTVVIAWYLVYRLIYKFLERKFKSNPGEMNISESETLDEHLRE